VLDTGFFVEPVSEPATRVAIEPPRVTDRSVHGSGRQGCGAMATGEQPLRTFFSVMSDDEFAAAVIGVQRRGHWWPFCVECEPSDHCDSAREFAHNRPINAEEIA